MDTRGPRVLAEAADRAPALPGVYVFLDACGEIIYVGKAAVLRRRLRDHVRAAAAPAGRRAAGLVDRVADVGWVECGDEREALIREADLIVLLGPMFNAAHTGQSPDVFVRVDLLAGGESTFALTRSRDRPGRHYGTFPHVAKGASSRPAKASKAGYTALLRVLWAAQRGPRAAAVPRRIGGASPPLSHHTPLAAELRPAVHAYLSGTGAGLLRTAATSLDRDDVPPHVRAALTRDLAAAREFFELGPRRLRTLRLRHGLPAGPVAGAVMAELLAADLRSTLSRA